MLYFSQVLVAMVAAYFVGSILTGVWIGRKYRGVDIRAHGSGNAGATNAMRVLGVKLGILVLVMDVLKGFLPVVILPLILGMDYPVHPSVKILIGASAVLGHMFPWMTRFQGGKGVATGLGVFLAVAPKVMVIVLMVGLIVIGLSGYVSLVSVAAAVIVPYLLWWYNYPAVVVILAAIICGIVILRHQSNIVRLLTGRENRIWDKKREPETAVAIGTPDPGAGWSSES